MRDSTALRHVHSDPHVSHAYRRAELFGQVLDVRCTCCRSLNSERSSEVTRKTSGGLGHFVTFVVCGSAYCVYRTNKEYP